MRTRWIFVIILGLSLASNARALGRDSDASPDPLVVADHSLTNSTSTDDDGLQDLLKLSRLRRSRQRVSSLSQHSLTPPGESEGAVDPVSMMMEYASEVYAYDPLVPPSLHMVKFGIVVVQQPTLPSDERPNDGLPPDEGPDWSSDQWKEEWIIGMVDWMCDVSSLGEPHIYMHRVSSVDVAEVGARLMVKAEIQTSREAFNAISGYWRRMQSKFYVMPKRSSSPSYIPFIGRKGRALYLPVRLRELHTHQYHDYLTIGITFGSIVVVYGCARVLSALL